MMKLAYLSDRGVIEIAGADRVAFLQGLVSNDVEQVGAGRAVWAALLTPQGKWLADFFVLSQGERLLLDCERDQVAMLMQRLGRYRLRADVALRDVSAGWFVHVAWDGLPDARDGVLAAPDPRRPEAGWRILAAARLPGTAGAADWDAHRVALGLPDGSRDMETDKSVLLEAGFDELGGVSWSKGCYMGQELTARTKYRGLVKRRLLPVTLDAEVAPGTPVTSRGQEVGTMRSVAGRRGLALLRVGALDGVLECGSARLTVQVPAWLRLPSAA